MPEQLRAIDANVFLRYLLNDIPEQAERARSLIESEQPLGVTVIALAEVGWTLTGPRHKLGRAAVATQLIKLLSRENIVPLGFDKAEAQSTLAACTYRSRAANLGDALIAACARTAGVHEIYSFDRRFLRAGLTPFPPP